MKLKKCIIYFSVSTLIQLVLDQVKRFTIGNDNVDKPILDCHTAFFGVNESVYILNAFEYLIERTNSNNLSIIIIIILFYKRKVVIQNT